MAHLNPDDSIPTRESLLSRLKNWDDQISWQEFFDLYWRLIYNVARKAGLTEVESQEAVQETVLSVAKGIKTFKKDPKLGCFKAWLLNLTRWRIADQFRKRPKNNVTSASMDETSGTPIIERIPDPASFDLDALWENDWDQHVADTAMALVRSKVNPISYQMFELHVLKQWPAAKVARKLGVKMGRVYFAKYKISRLIRKEARRLEDVHG
jgi:RNA polymerase sigma-70 factor (ECF subfamily)